ncbi:MAG: hypothetical protein PHP82_03735 [Candidatus ainarchaeum sp.]|nr:hypothetical protein [Candidatus ainarchaeum sp.]
MNNKFFSSERKAFFFVIEEFFLLLLILFQFYFLLGIERQGFNLIFFTKPIFSQNVLWLVSTILFFITLYFGISMRDKKVIVVHKEFSKLLFGTAKQKVFGINKEVFVLFVFEFCFAIIIALAIYFYLDPDISFPYFERVQWPFNLIAFIAFVAFGLYVFSLTKPFRDSIYNPSVLSRKILPAKRLFPTRRITNKKTGTIRVHGKKKVFVRRK